MKAITSFLLMSGIVFSYILMTSETDIEFGRSPASIPQEYDTLNGCQKQEVLWTKVQESTHKDLPDYRKFGAIQLLSMSFQELTTKGELLSDFSPSGWKKYLHRRGSVAKVKIVPVSKKYSGIFQGADCALLRLSLTYRPAGGKPVAPGLALKVLRDSGHSANISALVSLDGQGNEFNILKYPMSNIVPVGTSLGQKLVHKLFKKVSRYPEELIVDDMAEINAKGETEKTKKSPRQLFFVPSTELKFSSEEHDIRDDLATVSQGTTIYKLFALSEKHLGFDYTNYDQAKMEAFLSDSEHVADIVTTSEFSASEFGDDGLFFRHQLRIK